MSAFDNEESLGNQSRWRQFRYLLSIHSYCEALGVMTGLPIPKWF